MIVIYIQSHDNFMISKGGICPLQVLFPLVRNMWTIPLMEWYEKCPLWSSLRRCFLSIESQMEARRGKSNSYDHFVASILFSLSFKQRSTSKHSTRSIKMNVSGPAAAGYAGWQLENETLRQMLRPVLRRLCRLRPHQIIVSCQAPWQLHLHPSLARTLHTLITRIHVTTSGGSSWPNLIQNYFLLMRNIRAKCSKLRLLWQKDSPVDLKLGERSTLPMASWEII